VSGNLREALGEDGTTALLARALTRTETHHPSLKSIWRLHDTSVHLDGVAAAAEQHGVAEVALAIEALFAALIDVLSRLVGEDMAIRIVDHDVPTTSNNGRAPSP
jgi:hypothetical protein